MNRLITLDGREIAYELEQKKVKNINLRIRSNCSVYVSANNNIAENVIEEFLKRKTDYIFSTLSKYAEITKYANINHNYVTGESFRYLGRDLRMVVIEGKNDVISDGVHLTLSVKEINDTVLKENLIGKWYDEQCRDVFKRIIVEIYPVFQKYGVILPKMTFRDMSSRWGSCQPKKGVITLNKRLIEIPRNAVQYVVMHEFVHFLHHNHSDKFYEMLSALMPDWKARKKLLETEAFHASE